MTMQQLLEGLLRQNEGDQRDGEDGQGGGQGGNGPNQGGGQGGQGFGFGGNGQPGFSMMDVPVLGPERLSLNPSQAGGPGGGNSKQGAGSKPEDLNTEKSNWKPGDTEVQSRHSPDPESIPEAYRDAIKLYYSGDDR